MKISEFQDAVAEQNFEVGDVFWLGDWEFEVVGKRDNPRCRAIDIDRVACRWDVTEYEFIYAICSMQCIYPEIEDAVEFYHEHKHKIIDNYIKGFRALIAESKTSHETVMSNAIKSAMKEEKV